MADQKFIGLDDQTTPELGKAKKFIGLDEPPPFKSPIPTDDVIGRNLVEGLPMMGAIGGSPFGGLGTTAGILLGNIAKQKLQQAFPDKVGPGPSTGADAAWDFGKEVLMNQTAPWALGKTFNLAGQVGMHGVAPKFAASLSNFPAVREGAIRSMTDQIRTMLNPETLTAGKIGMLPDYTPPGQFQPIEITPGQEFQPFRKGQPFQMPTKPVVNAAGELQRVDRLGELIGSGPINAEKTLGELTGENAIKYRDAMAPETYDNLKDLLGTMQKMQKSGKVLDTVIKSKLGRLVWGGLTLSGHPGAASPVILNSMLGRIMENPDTAKLVVEAMRTPVGTPKGDFIDKALRIALPRLFSTAVAPE